MLIRLVGGAALKKVPGATRHRMSRNPLSPQVPRLRLVEYRLDYLLGLMAVEAVATGETGITYRVSWGI